MPNPTCGLYARHHERTPMKDPFNLPEFRGLDATPPAPCGVHADTLTVLKRTTEALDRAKDALRKIALNHPCDLHDRIAHFAMEDIKEIEG